MKIGDIIDIGKYKCIITEDDSSVLNYKMRCKKCLFDEDIEHCDLADSMIDGCYIEDEENGWDEGTIPIHFELIQSK